MAEEINYTAFQTILNWFKTGKKPTQQQFWDTWSSFWHKSEQIPISKIAGIQNIYDAINAVNDNLEENYVPYSGATSTVDIVGNVLSFDTIILAEQGILKDQSLQNKWPTTKGKLATVNDLVKPYKVYTALLSQSGANAPIATVLENSIGLLTWFRDQSGVYTVLMPEQFNIDKIAVIIPSITSEDGFAGVASYEGGKYGASDGLYLNILTWQENKTTKILESTIDNLLFRSFIEIRVYN